MDSATFMDLRNQVFRPYLDILLLLFQKVRSHERHLGTCLAY